MILFHRQKAVIAMAAMTLMGNVACFAADPLSTDGSEISTENVSVESGNVDLETKKLNHENSLPQPLNPYRNSLSQDRPIAQQASIEQAITSPKEASFSLNFSGADLRQVLQVIHLKTGERFLFDENLVAGKKVTFFSSKPITRSSLMPTLTSILEIQNLALVRVGIGDDTLYKVVSAEEASKQTTPTYHHHQIDLIPDSDEVVTLLFKLEHLNPTSAEKPLTSMASIPGAITVIEGSQIIKITDVASNIKRMVNLLSVMDESSYTSVQVEIVVKHALASQLASEIQPMVDVENQKMANEMLSKFSKSSKSKNKTSLVQATRPIVVKAIDRLNTIHLVGTEAQVATLKKLILSLDQPEAKRGTVTFIKLEQRKASELIPALQSVFSSSSPTSKRRSRTSTQNRSDISFQADDARNRIMVIAPASSLEKIKALISELDIAGEEGITRIYGLTVAEPAQVEQRLLALFTTPRGRSRKASPTSFQIVRDDDNRNLIIRGSELQHDELKTVIEQLDVKDDGGRTLVSYALQFTDANEVAQIVNNIMGHSSSQKGKGATPQSGPIITVDRNTNALMVLAHEDGHQRIADLLKTVDKESREKRVTQYYTLKVAKLESVAQNLRELYPTPRGRRNTEEEMSISLDLPTQTLIIKAELSRHLRIAETIEKLDIGGADARSMKTYPVLYVDVNEASRLLTEIIGIRQRSRSDKSPNTSDIIRADQQSSTIIVFGSLDTQNRVLEAMESIDIPNGERYQTVFYTIHHADPNLLFSNLREFFGTSNNRYSRQKDLFLSLNALSRTLMVKATPEKQKEVADAVKKLDVGGADPRLLKVYTLEYAGPKEASRVLSGLLNLSTSVRRGRSPDPYPDLISVDEANSSLVIFAVENTHESVEKTIETLDVESSAEEQIVYYRTQHLPILEAVDLLKEMFGFQTGITKGRPQSHERLTLDENSNTLIITASPKTHAKVRDVLTQVDVVGLGSNELHYYPIENTTAADAAKMIEQLFGLPSKIQKGSTVGTRSLPLQRNPMVIANNESNTLIVNAPRSTHQDIDEMLKRLSDIGKVDKMTVRFYPLENTNAADIAGQIAELFSLKLGESQVDNTVKGKNISSTKRNNGGAILRPLRPEENQDLAAAVPEPAIQTTSGLSGRNAFFFDGEPTVIPEINLNAVILVAPAYLHDEVDRTLKTMDKRRPQVMVEVAIVEVKGEDGLDLGVEWSYLDKNVGLATPMGLRAASPTGDDLGNLALQGAALPMEGLVAGVLRNNGSMPVVLQAIQNQKNLSIRSTPVLLVNDNEEAQFSSLTEEPTISTTQSNSSTKVSFNGFVEAGTSLTITPHISQGHYIRLEIDLKVESFTGEPISAGVPPPKSSNALITSVTVPDRQMVIIGGMVSEFNSELEKKVPLLGDLPLLGSLFKQKSKGKTLSKLYLFMAPKILRDEGFEDLKEITQEKSAQLERLSTGQEKIQTQLEHESHQHISALPSPRVDPLIDTTPWPTLGDRTSSAMAEPKGRVLNVDTHVQ